MKMNETKIYVAVCVNIDESGRIYPFRIIWTDGTAYEIDKILDVRPAASRKGGGIGTRFTCRINGQNRYLYWENPRWFVEAK